MFKPGEKIKRIADNYGGVKTGQIYTFRNYVRGETANIKLEEFPNEEFAAYKFISTLIKEPVKNDIEWLDRVQLNFKD